jgi:methylated-DNA-[protein]-cysteine S-methyltransferase
MNGADRIGGAAVEVDETALAAAASRFVDTAAGAGCLDVAYAEVESPIGSLLVAGTPRGLVRVGFAAHGRDEVLTELARRVSPRVLEAPSRLDTVRVQLDEYFTGGRDHFELAIDWALCRGFGRDVLQHALAIPYGSVTTYSALAAEAGRPRAARAAGNALGANPLCVVVPCHRVVRTGGGLGGYAGGLDVKRFLLDLEGVTAS